MMVSKKYKKEWKKVVTKVLEFYSWSTLRFKKDAKSREIARKGDILAAEIFALINDRVEPTIEGQLAAVIAITQSYAFLRGSVWQVEDDPDKLMEAFTQRFMGDAWRWVKHDHVQYRYEDFFLGEKVDSEKFLETVKNMHHYDEKNYK